MCDPFTLTTFAISAAATAAQYKAQSEQAQAQAKYQNEVAKQTGEIAQQNYLQQTGAANTRIGQIGQQTSQALGENQSRVLQASGSANTAAVESGVSGNSVDALLQDFKRQEAQAANTILTNQQMSTAQIQSEEEGLRAQAQGRIAASRPGPVATPSLLAATLTIAGSAYSAYNQSLSNNRLGPYDPNGNLRNQSFMFRPLPLIGGLLPQRQQPIQGGQLFS